VKTTRSPNWEAAFAVTSDSGELSAIYWFNIDWLASHPRPALDTTWFPIVPIASNYLPPALSKLGPTSGLPPTFTYSSTNWRRKVSCRFPGRRPTRTRTPHSRRVTMRAVTDRIAVRGCSGSSSNSLPPLADKPRRHDTRRRPLSPFLAAVPLASKSSPRRAGRARWLSPFVRRQPPP